jgi:hypothetical protein
MRTGITPTGSSSRRAQPAIDGGTHYGPRAAVGFNVLPPLAFNHAS